jgi:Flp pilus assembly pilin Flp
LRTLIRLLKDTRGLTTIEYGLLAVFIAAGLIVAFGLLGDNLSETYEDLNLQMQSRL